MKKLLSLTAILACVSCLGAYADADAVIAAAKDPGSAGVLSFGGFYGAALKDITSDGDRIDIFGVMVNYEFPTLIEKSGFTVSPFVESMLGYGYEEYTVSSYYFSEEIDTDVVQWTLAIGAKGRYQLADCFALTANVKIGLDVEYIEIDPDHGSSKDATAAGFLYGAGIGAEFQISKRWGAFLGVDYLGSTARPNVGSAYSRYLGEYDFGKGTEQSYVIVSIGATYKF